jgi:hypothetical protein
MDNHRFECAGRPFPAIDVTRVRPLRTFGGRGCEALCDYCRTPVARTDIEFEVEGELDGVPVTLHLHRGCHDLYRAEPAAQPQPSSGTTAVASISTLARASTSALTCTTAIAGKCRPITSR